VAFVAGSAATGAFATKPGVRFVAQPSALQAFAAMPTV